MNQESSRKIVILSTMIPAIMYVLISTMLVIGQGNTIEEYRLPFTILVCLVVVSEFISVLYVVKHWKINDGEDIAKHLTKDIVRLTMYHVFALIGFVYFLVTYLG